VTTPVGFRLQTLVRFPGGLFALKCRSRRCDELILHSTKPFQAPDATFLKQLTGTGFRNDAPERRNWGAQIVKQGLECSISVFLKQIPVVPHSLLAR
jgi:hypothetical protein